MKQSKILTLVLILHLPQIGLGMTAGEFIEYADAYDKKGDRGFAGGVFAGYVMGVHDSTNSCTPPDATYGQILAVVSNELRKHPEHWHFQASVFVAMALLRVFPCKQ